MPLWIGSRHTGRLSIVDGMGRAGHLWDLCTALSHTIDGYCIITPAFGYDFSPVLAKMAGFPPFLVANGVWSMYHVFYKFFAR